MGRAKTFSCYHGLSRPTMVERAELVGWERFLDKVKHGGTYALVTGVPDSAKSRPSVRGVAFDSKQDPKTLLYMAEAVRDGRLQAPISQKLRLKGRARRPHCNGERRRRENIARRVSSAPDAACFHGAIIPGALV
jgi:hypothetical protein